METCTICHKQAFGRRQSGFNSARHTYGPLRGRYKYILEAGRWVLASWGRGSTCSESPSDGSSLCRCWPSISFQRISTFPTSTPCPARPRLFSWISPKIAPFVRQPSRYTVAAFPGVNISRVHDTGPSLSSDIWRWRDMYVT